MPLRKGTFNSGIKNLIPYKKGKSGNSFRPRTISCVICGKDFVTRGTRTKYCSNKCINAAIPDHRKKNFICWFCKKDFLRKSHNNFGKFCSRTCSGMYKIATGDHNYQTKAFLFKPWKCNTCGIDDFSILVVHHKDIDRTNNKIDNLEILCANCHYRFHFGNGEVKRKKLSSIKAFLERKSANQEI